MTSLALAVSLGGLAFMTDHDDLARIGLLVSVPAATASAVGALRRQVAVNDDQLTEAHAAGYALALDHVARGLLDQHTAPAPDGTHNDTPSAHVHHLYALPDDDKRAAG
jgi:hypothetical protein